MGHVPGELDVDVDDDDEGPLLLVLLLLLLLADVDDAFVDCRLLLLLLLGALMVALLALSMRQVHGLYDDLASEAMMEV